MRDTSDRHPAIREFDDKFLVGDHLPEGLAREVSQLYRDTYLRLLDLLPDVVPLAHALDDLWDSKNHAVFLAVHRVPSHVDL